MNTYSLCCIHNGLADTGKKFRTMTLKRFNQLNRNEANKLLGEIYLNNLYVTRCILNECVAKNWAYRISSSLFPLITEPNSNIKLEELPQYHQICAEFDRIKKLIHGTGIFVSTHPDQFNVLASDNPKTVDSTIRELNFHGWLLDQMGAPQNYSAPINIHLNTYKGDLATIAERFRYNMQYLSESVKARLVVENEDKPNSWSVVELLQYQHILNVPITFDNLHHNLNPKGMTEEDAFHSCYNTWQLYGNYIPRFHFSGNDDPSNPRSHADLPKSTPNNYNKQVIWDVEYKGKEKAIRQILALN
jgi:UV DNA damage endonuclease